MRVLRYGILLLLVAVAIAKEEKEEDVKDTQLGDLNKDTGLTVDGAEDSGMGVDGRVKREVKGKDDAEEDGKKRKMVRKMRGDNKRRKDVVRKRKLKSDCPGRCVKAGKQCVGGKTKRSTACGKGLVCCLKGTKRIRKVKNGKKTALKKRRKTATKKKTRDGDDGDDEDKRRHKEEERKARNMEEEEEEGLEEDGEEDIDERFGKEKGCANRPACDDVWGHCQSKRKKCPKGTWPLKNSKTTKYCKKRICVCCAKEEPQECTSKKCEHKGGHCTKDPKWCEGRVKKSKRLCSGADCFCCLPAKPCRTKPKCEHMGGHCVNLKHGECDTEPYVGRQWCKGKGCGCCVPEEDQEPAEWGYTEENGPATWPAKFPQCGGQRQSPVALVSDDALGTYPWIPFKFRNYRYIPSKTKLTNNGHTAMVTLTQDEIPEIVGGDLEGAYKFLQFHFHWGKDETEGSEHTIDGVTFPSELHLVHYKASYGSVEEALNHDDGVAVLGIMLTVTYHDNPALTPIIDGLAKVRKADTETLIHPVPLQSLLPSNVDDFFRYEGSLTTPTCNEIVIWTVFKDTITISHRQLMAFRQLLDEDGNLLVENFRPVQPLNGREVFMGRESPYWSYIPPFDPLNWPNIFPGCASTTRQSPVALVTSEATGTYPRLTLGFQNYGVTPTKMTMFNNGHTAQVMTTLPGDARATMAGGDLDGKYELLQFHFHWGSSDRQGSEHTIDGRKFPIEWHLVHIKQSYGSVEAALMQPDGAAVLGVMGELSKDDNPKLWPIIEGLAKIHEPDATTELHPFPLMDLLPGNTESFFRYEGSLTTPTCNEIVIWTVFTETVPISAKQLAEFRKLMDDGGMQLVDNFRPPLPLNGREVLLKSTSMHWSYIGATGADKWGSIFPTCLGSLTRQSPIALSTASAQTLAFTPFTFTNYDQVPTSMDMINNGHTAQIMLESGNVPFISGGNLDGEYEFLQFHFHWGANDSLGSEHTTDGKTFPIELHLVHWKREYGSVGEALNFGDGVAVLGIYLEITAADNPNLNNIINGLPNILNPETDTEITPFALNQLIPSNTADFFRYEGSLTTPTCNEIVIWTVFKDTIGISHKQLEEFRKMLDVSCLSLVDNFRPVQNLSGRTVYMS